MISTIRLTVFSCAALASPLTAQAGSRFIGLTDGLPTVQSQDLVTCQARRCGPNGFPSTTLPGAGGSAYDTRTRGTWITNGLRIAKVDSRNQCDYQCPIQGFPNPSINNYVTGLAYEHRGNRLFVTDSANWISVFRIQGCSLTLASRCQVMLPATQMLTGIAIDDVGERVFYTSSTAVGPSFGGGTVYVARLGNVCQPLCRVSVNVCPNGNLLGPLTGIGYDACQDEIWVTDGSDTVSGRILTATCQIVLTGCCPNPAAPNERYVGLCIEPSTEDSVGQPCTNGVCPPCAPVHFLNGDPVVGNLGFTVDAANLPAGTIASTLFNFGPCSPTGVTVPPICGPLHVALSPTLLGFPEFTGVGVGCSGSTSLQVSIAANPNLCGLVISTQVLGLCFNSGGGFGTYSSNCLSWMITGS